ncbi:MFS family permease [Rhodococcus sp. LBL1]|uniref:MFS family permease n=1 Tax=Prescottella agglutinans TaxID=1644129 RepID=A0ABT6MBJ6_9NOCA|nr:MFS transporter [Prescottella agglutinans]MDH6281678.1 MFS family permease [Prescottella agglutinans]MDH6675914.1 MFS family permease [Rhodococcus sp. LBL1]MDH6681200.1 MFS family permease [Rhodococcus sp. LBL2]
MSRSDARVAEAITLDDEERRRVQKRTLTVVVVSQILGGAGLAAGITVGALLAQQMLGSDSLAGAPTALFTLGSALAAFLVGRITQSRGRRIGLGLGFGAGGIGAIGVVLAAMLDNVPLLFVSLFVYGAGTATNLQARYAGTDLAPAAQRGTAISIAMVSTTLGAVAGPNLVEPLGELATSLGLPALSGPFLLAAVAYLAAGTALIALLRPDPLLLARRIDAGNPVTTTSTGAVPRPGPGAYVGATVMVLTQIAMVAIMTMTPVHMRAHHHGLGEVGLVIGIHVGSMYLPSLVTGVLVDRVGRLPMAAAAGVTLLLAGVTAAFAPGDSLALLIVALALLGLGWNFGLISGTALVVDATVPENRPRTQGTIDVLIALAGAGGGAVSGVVMSATDYATLSLGGGALALLLIPVLFWARRDRSAPASATAGEPARS